MTGGYMFGGLLAGLGVVLVVVGVLLAGPAAAAEPSETPSPVVHSSGPPPIMHFAQASESPSPVPEPTVAPSTVQEVRLSDAQLEVFTKGIALTLMLLAANVGAQLWR